MTRATAMRAVGNAATAMARCWVVRAVVVMTRVTRWSGKSQDSGGGE